MPHATSLIIAQPRDVIGAYVNEKQGLPAQTSWGNFSALGLLRDESLVAGVIFNNAEGANVCIHIGAEEGCRWMTPEFLFACFDYTFNQLKKRRATALMHSSNKRAIEFAKNLGFKYEGKMRHYWKNGDDAILYGMLKEECRFLKIRGRS